MPAHITLIELYQHSEVVRTLFALSKALDYSVTILTNQGIFEDLYEWQNDEGVEFIIQEKSEQKRTFVQRILPAINHSNLVIFTTLVDELAFFSRTRFSCPTVLVIHNGHFFFDPQRNLWLEWSWRDLGRLVWFYLTRQAHYRKRLLDHFTFLSFSGEEVDRYMQTQYRDLTRKYQILPTLPFTFNEEKLQTLTDKKPGVQIVIPGTVNLWAKDFAPVIAAFSKLVPDLKKSLILVLAGAVNGERGRLVVQELEKLSSPFFEVRAFENGLPQRDFDQFLRQADFLILPVRKHLKVGICREIYGYTNISGGINDLIRFGVPALVPDSYPLEEKLQTVTEQYKGSEDLTRLLNAWIVEEGYLVKTKQMKEAMMAYSKEKMAKQLEEIIRRTQRQTPPSRY